MAWNLEKIEKEMTKFKPDQVKNYPKLKVKNFVASGFAGVNSVMYKMKVEGSKEAYQVIIRFNDLKFSDHQADKNYIKIMIRGEEYWFTVPSWKHSPVQLKCNCHDFRFTWEYALSKIGSLIGKYRRYQRKTTTRPPRNAQNVPGMCKHVLNGVDFLFNSKLLVKDIDF